MQAAMPDIFPKPQRTTLTGGIFHPRHDFTREVAEAAATAGAQSADSWLRDLNECADCQPLQPEGTPGPLGPLGPDGNNGSKNPLGMRGLPGTQGLPGTRGLQGTPDPLGDLAQPEPPEPSAPPADQPFQTLRQVRDTHLPPEGYVIDILADGIRIGYADDAGLFYAFKTLKQLFCQYGSTMPALQVEDWPDFPMRGILLDIGRGKVPQMKTLYRLIDLFADLKINHVELYMEGYAFAYQRHRMLFPDTPAISARELQLLDQYARLRFIDLVPNQNCLGHMEAWLNVPEFADLAEAPEGVALVPGLPPQVTTLNPRDPRSIELVRELFDELLPNFQSRFVNINMDEPFELGRGRSREAAAAEGTGALYLDYLDKVIAIVKAHDRQPLMWADFIFAHPELLDRLPPGITVLDWLYEGDASFEAHALQLQAHRIPFILCPGTSSWNSIAGRTDNMKANIRNAAEVGLQFGARGILTTDWGDAGHWQCLPVSYPGFAYGAAFSWNCAGSRDCDAASFLDRFVFQDRSRVMGRFWEDAGNYYHFERVAFPNRTLTFLALSPVVDWHSREDFRYKLSLYHQLARVMSGSYGNVPGRAGAEGSSEDYDYDGLRKYLARLEETLGSHAMHCTDAAIVQREALFTLRMVRHGADIYLLVNKLDESEALSRLLPDMLAEIEALIESFSHLWLQRYRGRWLASESCTGFHILLTKYKTRLAQLSLQEQAVISASLPA